MVVCCSRKSPNAKVNICNHQGKLKIRGNNKKSLYPAVTEVRLLTEEKQTQEEKSNRSVKMQPVKKLVKVRMEENSQESQHFMLKQTNI